MEQSQRTFEKTEEYLAARELDLTYRGTCGQLEGKWYYVPSVPYVGAPGGMVLMEIHLTPMPSGPNGCRVSNLEPLLRGSKEVKR
jgi:hypothetical protein